MFDNVRADYARYEKSEYGLAKRLKRCFEHFGFHALLVYRLGQWSAKRTAPVRSILSVLCSLLEYMVRVLYDIRIKRTAAIAPGMYIGHFGGILVGECMIGSNCSIGQRVVIDRNDEGAPVIGEFVWIGPHARIVGPFHIGDGATIGAGAVVTNDVPARCLALGNPARVLKKDYDNRAIVRNPWPKRVLN